MTTIAQPRAAHPAPGASPARVMEPRGPAYWLSAALAVATAAAAVLTWLGAVAFLGCNALMFLFASPANRLFPLYLAMLALAAWSAGTVLRQADVPALGALFSARTPVRGIAVYMWAVTGLNAAAWLSRIIPALSAAGAPAYLRGTGLATNVVYIQDLALWLPLLAAITPYCSTSQSAEIDL